MVSVPARAVYHMLETLTLSLRMHLPEGVPCDRRRRAFGGIVRRDDDPWMRP